MTQLGWLGRKTSKQTNRLTRGLITLVNDNDVDNYRMESLAFVFYGSIVNNRSNYKDEYGEELRWIYTGVSTE